MNEVKEEWRLIPGYGNLYYISNYGRVYRCKTAKKQSRIVKATKPRKGAPFITLAWDGRKANTSIPKLLDLTFGLEGDGPYYEFKDGNRDNLFIENIRRTRMRQSYNRGNCLKDALKNGGYSCTHTLNGKDYFYIVKGKSELKNKGINSRLVDICFDDRYQGRAISNKTNKGIETLVVYRPEVSK